MVLKRKTFVMAAVTSIACLLETVESFPYEDCPETSIFPKLVGLAKGPTENKTELTTIDYCEQFEFVVAGGYVNYEADGGNEIL